MSFRQDFTFSRFVRTPSSAAAWRLALAVAEGRADAPRVLLFHGPSGTGKTHLLHAIAHTTAARTAAAQIRTVAASDLSSQLVAGLRSDQVAALHRVYADIDLLLIDDLHALVDKPGTQAEIGRHLRAWTESGVRIVAASGVPPGQLVYLTRELQTIPFVTWVRLKRGSEGETRRLALVLLARQAVVVRPTLLDRLVRQSRGDVRRLIGAATFFATRPRQPRAKTGPPWLAGRRRSTHPVDPLLD